MKYVVIFSIFTTVLVTSLWYHQCEHIPVASEPPHIIRHSQKCNLITISISNNLFSFHWIGFAKFWAPVYKGISERSPCRIHPHLNDRINAPVNPLVMHQFQFDDGRFQVMNYGINDLPGNSCVSTGKWNSIVRLFGARNCVCVCTSNPFFSWY